jgi:hypothetical protein
MVDYGKIKPGDRLRIVGMGAPGFAKLGDLVTVTKTAPNRCDVVRADGESAFFALTCGAQRLEMAEPEHQFTASSEEGRTEPAEPTLA